MEKACLQCKLGIVAQLSILTFLIHVPFMQSFFGTTALGIEDWMFLASLALIVVFAEEIRKFFSRRWTKNSKNWCAGKDYTPYIEVV